VQRDQDLAREKTGKAFDSLLLREEGRRDQEPRIQCLAYQVGNVDTALDPWKAVDGARMYSEQVAQRIATGYRAVNQKSSAAISVSFPVNKEEVDYC
jgi:hypothetical protein